VKCDSYQPICIPDGSADALRILRQVDVIGAKIQHINSELPAVRGAQRTIFVAVSEKEKTKLQECLSSLCDHAEAALLLLCSLYSISEEHILDTIPVRIARSQQVMLGSKLLDAVQQLGDCQEDLSATIKKQQYRSLCLKIAADCEVLPLSNPRLGLHPQKRFSCPGNAEESVKVICQEKSVGKRLQQISSAVEELVFYQSEAMNIDFMQCELDSRTAVSLY
jgi:hypothetical protein